jgi:hypothetical protein
VGHTFVGEHDCATAGVTFCAEFGALLAPLTAPSFVPLPTLPLAPPWAALLHLSRPHL